MGTESSAFFGHPHIRRVATLRIVCLGDSVTRGISYSRGRLRIVKENYPALLQDLFDSDRTATVEVVNLGVFNDTSDGLVARLPEALSLRPDIVVVEIGGNDCNFQWDSIAKDPTHTHEPMVPLKRYLNNVQQLAAGIRDAGALPAFCNLPPLDPVRYYRFLSAQYGHGIARWIAVCGGIEHWHGNYNRALNHWLDRSDWPKIDVRTAFKLSGDLSALLSDDGIHPTPEGYRVMSEKVYSALLSAPGGADRSFNRIRASQVEKDVLGLPRIP